MELGSAYKITCQMDPVPKRLAAQRMRMESYSSESHRYIKPGYLG